MTCRTCRYNDIGVCRLNPPVASLSGKALWPRVGGGDWCSKHAPAKDRFNLSTIAETFCDRFDVTIDQLTGNTRTHEVAHLRQDFMLEAHEAGFTISSIGRFLHRDHTTVLYGIERAKLRKDGGIK